MAVHASITPDVREKETFTINGCRPLLAESNDYFRGAHALLGLITTSLAEINEITANDQLVIGAFDAIETLLAHGIFEKEKEDSFRAEMRAVRGAA